MLVKQKNRFITEVPFIITSGKVCRFFSKTIIDRDKRFFLHSSLQELSTGQNPENVEFYGARIFSPIFNTVAILNAGPM